MKGKGPDDVRDLSVYFAALALVKAKKFENLKDAEVYLCKLLDDGSAFRKFEEMVSAQHGNLLSIEKGTYDKARYILDVKSFSDGYVSRCDALSIAKACKMLGAGRDKKGDEINHRVGIVLAKKIGDEVKNGEVLAYVHADDENLGKAACEEISFAYEIVSDPVKTEALIYKTIC